MSSAVTSPVAKSVGPLGTVVLRGVRPLGGAPADVVVADGKIAEIRPAGATVELPCYGLDGMILLPGFVDLHTHLREPGTEDAETIASGTRAAAAGGYTDVFAMANTDPVTDSPQRVAAIVDIAARTAACRVHPVAAITKALAGQQLAPMASLIEHGVRMFSDDGKCVDDAALLREALAVAAQHDVLIAQHAQHGQLAGDGQINAGPAAERTALAPWPAVAEETIVARDAILAAEAGAALHICHASTAGTVDIIRWAKALGWPVTAEVTPHHLLLTDELAALQDTRYKVNPPLRRHADVAALREAVLDGTIDAVATDHAPHTTARKSQPWCSAPFGMTGLETALPVLAHVLTEAEALDWTKVAELMAFGPARIAGIPTSALRIGDPATFCLVDPNAGRTVDPAEHRSKSANTPFRGMWLPTNVIATSIDGYLTHSTEAFEEAKRCDAR
ncbi:dihydroorotase [Streptomyces antimycoticus]|uniref:dihydroorotase n=1 Tax=Streptomyces antimycoticus TaxID=68175 RepID=UPI000A3CDF8B|nr:dihydroorotase [Streptomyces antimycoticus]